MREIVIFRVLTQIPELSQTQIKACLPSTRNTQVWNIYTEIVWNRRKFKVKEMNSLKIKIWLHISRMRKLSVPLVLEKKC